MSALRTASQLSCLCVALGVACQSTASGPEVTESRAPEPVKEPGPEPAVEQVLAPVDATDEFDSIWPYLSDRYDGDGDGSISPAEYAREGGAFERLDRNLDGVISPADFERSDGPSPAMLAAAAQRVVAWCFQDDADTEVLTLTELEQAVGGYDENADGFVAAEEFAAAFEDRKAVGKAPSRGMQRRMGDPWEALAASADGDGDGRLGSHELVAFFRARDDGDDVWNLAPQSDRGSSRPAGAKEGDPAPDFTLTALDGEREVTLSSFRGDRPVALIFGSYT